MHSIYTAHENPFFQLALFLVITAFYFWLASPDEVKVTAIAPPASISEVEDAWGVRFDRLSPSARTITATPSLEDGWETPVIQPPIPEPVEVATTKPKARRPRQPRRAK